MATSGTKKVRSTSATSKQQRREDNGLRAFKFSLSHISLIISDSYYQKMRTEVNILLLIGIVFISGCTVKLNRALQYGNISQNDFSESVDVKIQNGLIFIPVTIDGNDYRFLFDTGAPLSISEELQTKYAYKTTSKGNIIDSDHNRKKVKWVTVDMIQIGNISFADQTAFIGDFKANPILKCLQIDGIIGSNLMRHCNWTIDQELKKVSLHSEVPETVLDNSTRIPFTKDFQYNIFLNLTIGEAIIKNIRMDYGSNGSVALNKEIFSVLKQRGIIDAIWTEKGVQQSGIIGEPVELAKELTISDSVRINNIALNHIELRTGKTDLVGNKVWSRFKVTIDWENMGVYLKENPLAEKSISTYGFRIGYHDEKGIYIQSVTENSKAHKMGIEPNMKVTRFDDMDFENGNEFCDYLNHDFGDQAFIEIVDSKGNRLEFNIDKITF